MVILHHEIRKTGEDSLSGETAFTHRYPLIHALHCRNRDVIHPVNIKRVQVKRFLSDSNRSNAQCPFLILL